jgi:hypothetical protein
MSDPVTRATDPDQDVQVNRQLLAEMDATAAGWCPSCSRCRARAL